MSILATCWLFIGQVSGQVEVVNTAESTSGWGGAATLTTDSYEGQFAIAYEVPGDKTGFLSFDHSDTGIDLSQYQRIAFWWKVEGDGLQDLKIKVRNYPLAGGMEAVYTLFDSGDAPKDWALAVATVAEPNFDDWGGEPNLERRYITFRTVTSPGANVRLFIDRIVVLPEALTWSLETPVFDPTAGPDVDFDGSGATDFGDFLLFASAFGSVTGDAEYGALYDLDSDGAVGFADFIVFSQGFGVERGRWDVSATFNNPFTDSVDVAINEASGQIFGDRIPPGLTELSIQLPPSAMSGRDPSDSHRVELWAQVNGITETRTRAVTVVPQTGESRTWSQYKEAIETGSAPILPIFSYAGYAQGRTRVPEATGTVFRVADYGAIANDDLSDHSAIQSTIDAAEANEGGIVLFDSGLYLVNTDSDPRDPITLQSSDIVMKGAGSGEDGTIIRQMNYMPPTDPNKLWSSPYMFQFKPAQNSDPVLATIIADSDRETFDITVDNSSQLVVGNRVRLEMTSTAAVRDFLAPYTAESSWESLWETGIRIREKHTIADTQGQLVTLAEPLHTSIKSEYGWRVRNHTVISNVGVEDIRFEGTWSEPFVHHKDAIHDGGWSLLQMSRVTDAWIRRCVFVDVNRAVSVGNSANVSIYHVTMSGNKGHSSIAVGGSYGVWVGLSEDLAAHHHGPGSSARSCGTVYWRYDMQRGQRIDAHGDQPYANLLDCVNGGILYGSGAAIENFPNHLGKYTLWNFNHRGSNSHYDFWQPGTSTRNRFVRPIVVGFHGDPVTFNEENLEVLESLGSPVEPQSLYEAQLELRLGEVPAFYNELREEWEGMKQGQD